MNGASLLAYRVFTPITFNHVLDSSTVFRNAKPSSLAESNL
jgi:hypothetical protein